MLDRDVGGAISAPGPGLAAGDDATSLITDLPYGPEAAEVARGAVALALRGTETDVLADARLIGSELATNAFVSGSPSLVLCVDRRSLPGGGLEVEITVTDGGCSRPAPACPTAPDEQAESGRGLAIVDALADAWSLTTGTSGSRAWCRLTHRPCSSSAGA
ncbi:MULTISPECIES: ATP-binding protein [Streptomyces]|uniref:ATP-binding protein n=1 Tax=Streptomyces TaxID=1883 RepID=UPI001EFEB138|nr:MULTISPECIES: ATP-binding protein [Streptomyces]MDI7785652.1 ATP-binding protein [Streptomyces cavourensis]